jgi:DNA-binding MarR family transcriptional regulator
MTDADALADPASRHFVEAVGLFFEDTGVPRIGGRVLGLLLLADRPLSLDAIARTLQVSRASVSTNSRLLLQSGMVERAALPGDRRDYYQFAAHAWESRIEAVIGAGHAFLRLLDRGQATIDPANAVGRARLLEAREFYGFITAELSALLDRWRRTASSASPTPRARAARAQTPARMER